jgi:hypothetical protein
VEHLDLDVPEVEQLSVPRASKFVLCIGALVQHVFGASNLRQLAPAGDVIGVQMGIEDPPDLQIVFFGYTDVEFRIIDGVAHGALSPTASAENVRSGHRLLMKQLT